MYLFDIVGERVSPSVHALLIPELAVLWEENKDEAIKHFSYIEFTASKKKSNPFNGYKKDSKDAKIKEKVYGDPNYELPHNVVIALEEFKEMQIKSSSAVRLLDSAEISIERTTDFLETVDYTKVNKAGMPIWKPKDVLDAIGKMDKALSDLGALRDKVDQDLYETAKTVKDRNVNPFER